MVRDKEKLNKNGRRGQVLRHDIEFFLVLAGLAGLLIMLESTNLKPTAFMAVIGTVFAGYLTYSGYKLLNILK